MTTEPDYDDHDYDAVPARSVKQIARQYVERALPVLPYIPLAVGIKTHSTEWLLVAVFTMLVVKPYKRSITVSNCSFTSSGTQPGLLVK